MYAEPKCATYELIPGLKATIISISDTSVIRRYKFRSRDTYMRGSTPILYITRARILSEKTNNNGSTTIVDALNENTVIDRVSPIEIHMHSFLPTLITYYMLTH